MVLNAIFEALCKSWKVEYDVHGSGSKRRYVVTLKHITPGNTWYLRTDQGVHDGYRCPSAK